MTIEVKHWLPCEECEGDGRVWEHLKGAGYLQTRPCGCCFCGRVLRYMTKAEKREMAEQILRETEEVHA